MIPYAVTAAIAGIVVCLGSILIDVNTEKGPFKKHAMRLAHSGLVLAALGVVLLMVA
jgi:hypothetical protein